MQTTAFDYIAYDETAKAQQAALKGKFLEISELIYGFHLYNRGHASYRSASNAMEALEVAYMWIGKAIRDQQLALRTAEPQEGRGKS